MKAFRVHRMSMLSALLLFVSAAFGADATLLPSPLIAVMPTADYADAPAVAGALTPVIADNIARKQYELLDEGTLRQTLRKYRVRNSFELSSENMRQLADETGIDFVLLSSLDYYDENDGGAEVSVSLRLLRMPLGEMYWAHTESRHSRDTNLRLPGYRHDSLDELLWLTLAAAFENFRTSQFPVREITRADVVPAASYEDISRGIAVLIPANETSHGHAGQRIANQLVAALHHRGYLVIDPGLVHGSMLAAAQLSRGEITRAVLDSLSASTDTRWVLTGTLRDYKEWHSSDRTDCSAALDLRLIDARSGLVVWSDSRSAKGSEQAALFGMGAIHGVTALTNRLIESMAARLPGRKIHLANSE